MAVEDDARIGDEARAFTRFDVALQVVVSGFIAARLYTRFAILRLVGLEDALIIASWVLFLVNGVVLIRGLRYDIPYYDSLLDPKDELEFYGVLNQCEFPWLWSKSLAKAAFAAMYTNLFPQLEWLNRHLIKALVGEALVKTFLVLFACGHPDKVLHPITDVGVDCLDLRHIYYAAYAFHMIINLILFTEPIPIIWNLMAMTFVKKVGMMLMLSLGLLTTVLTTLRVLHIMIQGDNRLTELYFITVEPASIIVSFTIPSLLTLIRSSPALARLLRVVKKPSDPDAHRRRRSARDNCPLDVAEARRRAELVRQRDALWTASMSVLSRVWGGGGGRSAVTMRTLAAAEDGEASAGPSGQVVASMAKKDKAVVQEGLLYNTPEERESLAGSDETPTTAKSSSAKSSSANSISAKSSSVKSSSVAAAEDGYAEGAVQAPGAQVGSQATRAKVYGTFKATRTV